MTPDDPAALVTRMKERLPAVGEPTFEALERFSGPMLEEVLARSGQIESKAISILGWSTALLGLLLIQVSGGTPPAIANRWLLSAAIVATVVALAAAAEASRPRRWKWPTTRHWFCEDQFDQPNVLRALHLTALLEAYQSHARVNAKKATALEISQWAIVIAGALVAAALVAGL